MNLGDIRYKYYICDLDILKKHDCNKFIFLEKNDAVSVCVCVCGYVKYHEKHTQN